MDGDRGPSRSGSESVYCSNCGTGLEPPMNYCPNCGTPNKPPGRGRTQSTSKRTTGARRTRSGRAGSGTERTDRDVLEHRIATASRDGWELEHDFGDHAVMVRRSFGSVNNHLIIGVLTVWFTMGIGNALYGAYRYFGDAERIVLRAGQVEGSDDTAEPAGRGLIAKATAGVCWLTAAIVAAIAIQFGGGTALGFIFGALAIAFAVLGVSVLPSVSRRLENRHSVTANGRVRSVDERSIVSYDRPCAACADPVGQGLERTYRKEFCVLGVPLTGTEGHNYYCRQCADGTGTTTRGRSQPEDIEAGRGLEADPERETESA